MLEINYSWSKTAGSYTASSIILFGDYKVDIVNANEDLSSSVKFKATPLSGSSSIYYINDVLRKEL